MSVALSVAKKELVESFRDRQMILYGIVLPLAMYPAMFWVMIQATLIVRGLSENTVVEVELVEESGASVPEVLSASLSTEREDGELPEDLARIATREVQTTSEADARERLAARERSEEEGGRPDAVLFFGTEHPKAQLYYDSTEGRSTMALARLEQRLPELADGMREEAVRAAGEDPEQLHPLELAEHNLAPEESMGSYMLSFILPMMLVIMTVMGAFFPAVDLTAGEKERGTIETTLVLPVPKRSVHLGKILAVCASACVAAALNLMAMGLSAGHVLSMLASGAEFRVDLPITAFFAIMPLALLFALFVSTVLTSLAALTKTFKEGQAMLGPVQFLFFAPAVVCAIPGLELTPGLAAIPVVNIVLAFKSMLRGEFLPLELAICVLSLSLLAAFGSWFALRLLSRESLQLSGSAKPLRHLLTLLRSDSGAH